MNPLSFLIFALAHPTTSDIGAQVFTGLATGGGVLGLATLFFRVQIEQQRSTFQALIAANTAHIESLTRQLSIANESHSKHLEKENLIVNALSSIQVTLAGLQQAIQVTLTTQQSQPKEQQRP